MRTSLFHQDNADNRRVLRGCPSLREGFRPRRWLRNPHAQIGVLLGHERRASPIAWDHVERLQMADGGLVSLQWLGTDDPARHPVVLLMPTIIGDGDGLGDLVRHLRSALGWTVVVCNRRGHAGVPLATPRFNTMGEVGDLRAQIDAVRRARPAAALFAIGVSAGSGLLARYLGETPNTPIRAAAMHCPGYDLEDLFDHAHPMYSRLMAHRVKRYFLDSHVGVLGDHPDYLACAAARDLAEFHRRLHGLAGFSTRADYLRASNPMEVAHDIKTPLLVLNAADDPVCSIRVVNRVRRSLIAAIPHGILAITRYGSHCAHFEGLRRRVSWAHRVLVEYLRAQHQAA
jgi:uncharacterized protein